MNFNDLIGQINDSCYHLPLPIYWHLGDLDDVTDLGWTIKIYSTFCIQSLSLSRLLLCWLVVVVSKRMRSDDNKGGSSSPAGTIDGGIKWCWGNCETFITSSLRAVLSYAFGTRLCFTRAYAGNDLWKYNVSMQREHILKGKGFLTWTLVTCRGFVSWPWWWWWG